MAGIDVRVTISAQDQGAAAQLEALKKTAAELGVQFNATAEQAGGAARAVGSIGGTTGRLEEASRAAAGMAFEVEGLGRGGRFAALEMGRFVESIGLMIPGLGEVAGLLAIVATGIASAGLIEETLGKKQEKASAAHTAQTRLWQKENAEELASSVRRAEADVAARQGQVTALEQLRESGHATAQQLSGGQDTAVKNLAEAYTRLTEVTARQAEANAELERSLKHLRAEYATDTRSTETELGRRLAELKAKPTSSDPGVAAQQQLQLEILKTRDEYDALADTENKRYHDLVQGGAQTADTLRDHIKILAQIRQARDAALKDVRPPVPSSDPAVRLAQERAQRDQQVLQDRYDQDLVTTRDYYAKRKDIEDRALGDEIALKDQEFEKTKDPARHQALLDDIRNLREQRLAIDTHYTALEIELEHKLQQEQSRQTISVSQSGIRYDLGARVDSIRSQVGDGSLSKAEGARELSAAYADALAKLTALYSEAELFAAVTKDPTGPEILAHIRDEYVQIQGEAVKASTATNDYAASIANSVGRGFDRLLEIGDKAQSFAQSIRAMALDLVRDLGRAFAAPLRDQIERTIKSALDGAKSGAGGLGGILGGLFASLGGASVLGASGGVGIGDFIGATPFSSGGPAVGPGSTTSDSIPARLSVGEHVWTADEVKGAGGHAAVYALRRRAAARFVGGGPVYRIRDRDDIGQSARFAGGGAVGSLRSAGLISDASNSRRGGEHFLTIATEEGIVVKHLESPAGERALIRVAQRNQRAFKRALDVG